MSYDLFQQTFALSSMTNLPASDTGTVAQLLQDLQTRIADGLKLLSIEAPGWSVSWGPCVWQAPGSNACDQAMAAFTNGTTDVVAIAGTNPVSLYDWLVEDADVTLKQDVTWPGAPAGAWISCGTQLGIDNLNGMSSGGQSLAAFLQARAGTAKNRTLIFTGHSLAGALSPTLALNLFTAGGLSIQAWNAVQVYPTAGYSPGNEAFSQFFTTLFEPTGTAGSYQVWNRVVWNALDVVPRAWDYTTLTGLPNLYGNDLEPDAWLSVLGAECLAHVLSGPDYKQLQASELTSGQVIGDVVTFQNYLDQMGFQHTKAYAFLLGMPALAPFLEVLPPQTARPVSKAKAVHAAQLLPPASRRPPA